MNLKDALVAGQAIQDQELAEGHDWFARCSADSVMEFFDAINDASGPELRELSDVELRVLRSVALIGLWEVIKTW